MVGAKGLVRYDSQGNELWTRAFGAGEQIWGPAADGAGVYVVGRILNLPRLHAARNVRAVFPMVTLLFAWAMALLPRIRFPLGRKLEHFSTGVDEQRSRTKRFPGIRHKDCAIGGLSGSEFGGDQRDRGGGRPCF